MAPEDLHYAQLVDVAAAIKARALSPVDLTEALLARIARLDPELNSFLHVGADLARAQAAAADDEIAAGRYRGPLHGVPIAIKDLCFTKDAPTTFGMKVYRDWIPDFDATVVRRLRQAGAVILGKLHLHEGAFATHHPELPLPLNPWNRDYWPGGSSSGSGVATAAGLCYASLGSDTGGSIRFPCNACSLTGVKVTWGRVSRHGVFPLAESLDTVGPMARSAADAAAVLGIIAGADPEDATSLLAPVPDYLGGLAGVSGARGQKIGIDRRFIGAGTDPEILSAVEAAALCLQDLGAAIIDVDMPDCRAVLDGQLAFIEVECASFHAPAFRRDPALFGPALARAVAAGLAYDPLRYGAHQMARDIFKGSLGRLFQTIDAMLLPVFPTLGIRYDHYDAFSADPQPLLKFSAPFNMAGTPSVTLPCGFSRSGLPIGMQLVGPHLSEGLLLRIAHAFQQATDWHLRHPAL